MINPAKQGDTEAIRAAVAEWRQGDYTLDVRGYLFADVTEEEGEPFSSNLGDAQGLIVISQTCDVVRFDPDPAHADHCVTVCPMVHVNNVAHVAATPSYASIEHSVGPNIVADLTRPMSVSKKLLARWNRVSGFSTDTARQSFAHSLERKFGRFAFPDEFAPAIRHLRDRAREKHKSDSPLGRVYQSVSQIRARAVPSWNASDIEVSLLVVVHDAGQRPAEIADIASEIEAQVKKVKFNPPLRWADLPVFAAVLDDITAREWNESQALDLDFISSSKKTAPSS